MLSTSTSTAATRLPASLHRFGNSAWPVPLREFIAANLDAVLARARLARSSEHVTPRVVAAGLRASVRAAASRAAEGGRPSAARARSRRDNARPPRPGRGRAPPGGARCAPRPALHGASAHVGVSRILRQRGLQPGRSLPGQGGLVHHRSNVPPRRLSRVAPHRGCPPRSQARAPGVPRAAHLLLPPPFRARPCGPARVLPPPSVGLGAVLARARPARGSSMTTHVTSIRACARACARPPRAPRREAEVMHGVGLGDAHMPRAQGVVEFSHDPANDGAGALAAHRKAAG